MQRVLFFLTFRSNREIFFFFGLGQKKKAGVFFFCSFFRLSGCWGNESNYFCFFERKHHLFSLFFKLITDVRSHIGLVWHFAMRFFFLDFDFSLSSMIFFFFAVGSFSICVF